MSNIIAGITKDLKAIPENLKAKAKGADSKKLVLLNVPYILVGYFCDKAAWLWRVSEGSNASDKRDGMILIRKNRSSGENTLLGRYSCTG